MPQTEQDPIGSYVRKAESDFTSGGGTVTSKYVTTDLYDDISRIYAYLESKHISGETDSLGRDKPFFNIVVAARNVWYRATDIDRKNIEVTPSASDQVMTAFMATVLLKKWMKKENFGAFLNDWGIDLAGFNSSVVKFIESAGMLHPMVIPWSRLICDVVDFDNNPKIEILELTEGQVRQRAAYDQDMVEELCNALAARTTTDGQQQDSKPNYIKLYEVHGLFPLAYLTGKEKDEDEYVQQMHVISYVASKEKGQFDDFTLYSGRETDDPYLLTSLLPNTDGSVSVNGSVKTLFQAQWMMNHTVKSMKDQLDLASKLFFQTADPAFLGRNALSSIEQGTILVHKENMPLEQVNNGSHDLSSQESFGNMWKSLSSEIAGISESMLGNTAPSGTAWAQVQALLQESHSLFELMTENKGLALIQMLTLKVIPFLKKQMDNADEVAALLEPANIAKVDAIYVPREAIRRHNRQAVQDVLSGKVPSQFDPVAGEAAVRSDLAPLGNQRFFVPEEATGKTWTDALKDLEWELDIDVTGEGEDKSLFYATMNTLLATMANPNYTNSPQMQLIVSKILAKTGEMSPMEIGQLPTAPTPPALPGAPVAPVAAPSQAPPVSGGLPIVPTT